MAYTHQLPLYTVDSFTDLPFSGNPAAVVLDDTDQGLTEGTMLKIAAEMNISETAFIRTLDKDDTFDKASNFGLRWFTPTTEVPLCGHATLASAAILFSSQNNSSSGITFNTASGDLKTVKSGLGRFTLDFPLNTPEPLKEDMDFERLVQGISGGHKVTDVAFSPTTRKLLVRLDDKVTRRDLEALKPDIDSLPSLEPSGTVKGVIVTIVAQPSDKTPGGDTYDFLSRYFAPWVGIPEDPVTGSAHTVLSGYWKSQLSKTDFVARQSSPRGGDLWLQVTDNGRVNISGNATVIIEGKISVPK